MNNLRKLLCLFSVALSFYGCSENETHEHAGHESEVTEEKHEDIHAGGEIVITETQSQKLGIKADSVRIDNFCNVIPVSGEILPAQGAQTVIVAKTSGVISFNRNIVPNSRIEKGTSLGSISSSDILGGDPIAAARIEYENAKAEFQRIEPLYESHIVDAATYKEAKQALEMAENAYRGAAKGSNMESPIGGIITQLWAENGSYIQAGFPIATVSDVKRLTLVAYLPQIDFENLPEITTANFRTIYDKKLYELRRMNGTKITSSDIASTSNGYVAVSFSFDNNGQIVPGSYVDVYLLGKERRAMVVPVSAITEEQGYYFVYVKEHAEHYVKQRVELGGTDGAHTEILSGLKPGDLIVVDGAILVKLAGNTGAIPEGHHHH